MYFTPLIRGAIQATAPISRTMLGFVVWNCFVKYGRHASISSCKGFLFLGVACLTTFVMKKFVRSKPFWAKTLLRNFPALPTNGLPVSSSSAPGFCPTSMTVAHDGPSPGTAFLAPCQSLHFRQIFISSFSSLRVTFGQLVVGL